MNPLHLLNRFNNYTISHKGDLKKCEERKKGGKRNEWSVDKRRDRGEIRGISPPPFISHLSPPWQVRRHGRLRRGRGRGQGVATGGEWGWASNWRWVGGWVGCKRRFEVWVQKGVGKGRLQGKGVSFFICFRVIWFVCFGLIFGRWFMFVCFVYSGVIFVYFE